MHKWLEGLGCGKKGRVALKREVVCCGKTEGKVKMGGCGIDKL